MKRLLFKPYEQLIKRFENFIIFQNFIEMIIYPKNFGNYFGPFLNLNLSKFWILLYI